MLLDFRNKTACTGWTPKSIKTFLVGPGPQNVILPYEIGISRDGFAKLSSFFLFRDIAECYV
jgi:hypothetical protein